MPKPCVPPKPGSRLRPSSSSTGPPSPVGFRIPDGPAEAGPEPWRAGAGPACHGGRFAGVHAGRGVDGGAAWQPDRGAGGGIALLRRRPAASAGAFAAGSGVGAGPVRDLQRRHGCLDERSWRRGRAAAWPPDHVISPRHVQHRGNCGGGERRNARRSVSRPSSMSASPFFWASR